MAKRKVNKKITPIQREYMEEARRVKRVMNKLRYQGYYFGREAIPTQPKRITEASVRGEEQPTVIESEGNADHAPSKKQSKKSAGETA